MKRKTKIKNNKKNKKLYKETKFHLKQIKNLFWDYKWESVIDNLESPFVIARILEMGSKKQVKKFISIIGDQKIIDFLEKYGKLLSKQSLNFWKLVYQNKSSKKE